MAKSASFSMGVRHFGRGTKTVPPMIGNGSVNGEICDSELRTCREQACGFCQEAIETLETLSKRFACRTNGVDQWIDQLSIPEGTKRLLRGLGGNITEIRRMKSAIESLRTEMLSGGESELGERKSRYFAFSPENNGSILFVSSLVYRPFDQWLEGKDLSLNGRAYQLIVVSCNGKENAFLTQGRSPTRVSIRGQRV